jgi:hypothetical protein
MGYLRAVVLHVPFVETMERPVQWTTRFDVPAWRSDDYGQSLDAYRCPAPRTFDAVVEPDRRALIESRLATFGEHPAGMGKFTRTMFAQDLRRTLVPVETSRELAAGGAK